MECYRGKPTSECAWLTSFQSGNVRNMFSVTLQYLIHTHTQTHACVCVYVSECVILESNAAQSSFWRSLRKL